MSEGGRKFGRSLSGKKVPSSSASAEARAAGPLGTGDMGSEGSCEHLWGDAGATSAFLAHPRNMIFAPGPLGVNANPSMRCACCTPGFPHHWKEMMDGVGCLSRKPRKSPLPQKASLSTSTRSKTPRQERQQAGTSAGSSTHGSVSACPALKIPAADAAHLADGAGRAAALPHPRQGLK